MVHPSPYGMAQLVNVILAVSGTAATPSMGSARMSVQRRRILTTGSQQPGRLSPPHPYLREHPLTICLTQTSLQNSVTILLKHFPLLGFWWSILMRQQDYICSNLMPYLLQVFVHSVFVRLNLCEGCGDLTVSVGNIGAHPFDGMYATFSIIISHHSQHF